MKLFITTFGCKANSYDSTVLEHALLAAGHEICSTQDRADAVIVNTCTVTSKADYQARQMLRRIARKGAKTIIVAAGCYARANPEPLLEMPEVSAVVEGTSPDIIIKALKNLEASQSEDRHYTGTGSESSTGPFHISANRQNRARAVLKIQDGCDEACSYCIVPKARGAGRSAKPEDAIAAVQQLADMGHGEVVLTGIHLGGYGKDLNGNYNLARIVREIINKTSVGRLRLSSVDPMEVDEELIELFGDKRLCPHMHLPVQSGCDRILSSMKRPYTSSDIGNIVESLLEHADGMSVGMDMIIGYPTETEDEFRDTYKFVESLSVAYLHVFPFSARPGTHAEALEPKIRDSVIKDRCFDMRELGDIKHSSFAEAQVGKTLDVAVEKVLEEGKNIVGKSGNYLSVEFASTEIAPKPGSIVNVVIESSDKGIVYGRIA